jgi:APA family basic amino acid/polyamine antiporter
MRLLGAGFGAAIVVGATVGAGILRTPGEVAGHLQSPLLVVLAWTLGGIYALLGALTVAELGIALPLAGGFTVYVRRAFGERAGFAIGACDWLGQTSAAAFSALTLADTAAQLWPGVAPARSSVAAAVVLLIGMLQWRSVRVGARTQELTSAAKAVAFLALIAACLLWRGDGAESVAQLPRSTMPALAAWILSAQAIFYTYDGWYSAIYFTEEDVAPSRNLLPGLLAGTAIVALIYVLMNVALLAVLPLAEMASHPIPAAAAATRVLGPSGQFWLAALVLVSALPNASASILMATRIPYALGRQGALHGSLIHVGAGGTPRVALAATLGLTLLLVLTSTAAGLLAIAGFFYVLNYVSAYACLWRLRQTEPDLPRPYRAWGYPWVTGLLLAASLAFLIGAIVADPRNSAFAILLLLLCAAVRRSSGVSTERDREL